MLRVMVFYFFFFFKQKTAYEIYQCDWSSDVCSSDLSSEKDKKEIDPNICIWKPPIKSNKEGKVSVHNFPDRKSVV